MRRSLILKVLMLNISIFFIFFSIGCSNDKTKETSSKATSKKVTVAEKSGLNDEEDEVTEADLKGVTSEQIQNFSNVYKQYANELTKINNLMMTDISGNRDQCETIKSGLEPLRNQLLQSCPGTLKDKLNTYFKTYDEYYSFAIAQDKYSRDVLLKYSEPDKARYTIENKVLAIAKKLGIQVTLY